MTMDEQTIRDFPALHYYVRVNLPDVANIGAIVSSIKKLSGKTSSQTIKNAMKWGNQPKIEVVDNLICAGAKSFGCYAWGSNTLRIDKALVTQFEAGGGFVKTAKGKRVFLLGVTLLHELTHWADAQDGVDDAVSGDASNEEGNAYEKAVYGKVLDHSDDA